MSAEVMRLDLRLRRRMVLGCAIGIGVYAFLIVALYPAFKDDASLDALSQGSPTLAALFGASGSLTSVEGWLNANLYANFVPLVSLLLTIGYGAAAIAGQDEDGILGLTATLPISRRHILIQKTITLGLLALVVPGTTLACLVAGPNFQLTPDWSSTILTTLGTALLALDFGLLALSVGALTESRGTALGVASTAAAGAYLISSLAPAVNWVHSIRWTSPFYWAVGNDQLTQGLGLGAAAALVIVGGALCTAAAVGFERLDVH